jgi:predicted peptidase
VKTWKHRTAWRVLVLSVLLFAAVLYFHVTATPIAGTTKRANDITPTPRVQATKHANYITPTPRVKTTTRSDYITRIFTDANGMHMTYYLYIPVNYDPQKKYPLVLLLHGGGESANVHNTPGQNRDVLLNQAYVRVWGPGHPGPGSPNVQEHWPSFIVVPQVVNPQRWVNVPAQQGSYTLAAQPTDSLRMAKEIVDALQKQYTNIDPDRLYITGLSMGGYGVWDAIERWPNYFAAAAPLAGAGDPSKASMLIHLPIWDFHGSQDATVPVSGSRDMIAAIKAAGGEPRYTEFPGEGHEVWDYVYSTTGTSTRVPDFFSWLFSQSKIRSTSLIQVK